MPKRLPFSRELDTPCLVIDLDALEANIRSMQSFFSDKTARLRPHFKTHKCLPIAHKQIAAGAKGITAAKVSEAEVLAWGGIKDVLIANQIVGEAKIRRLVGLARHTSVTVAVDSADNARELAAAARAAGATLGVLVEVDIGMGRCGVKPGRDAVELARIVNSQRGLAFRGLQGYEGHLVLREPGAEKDRLTVEAIRLLARTKRAIENEGLCCEEISGGGTGTYRVAASEGVMTEIQAGSYATMDARYAKVTPEFAKALFVLVTIISRPKKGLAIGDAGLKSITSEFGMGEVEGVKGAAVDRLSEEHTLIRVKGEAEKLAVGDRILVTPSHGCTTINLYDKACGVRKGYVECSWRIDGRGKSQ